MLRACALLLLICLACSAPPPSVTAAHAKPTTLEARTPLEPPPPEPTRTHEATPPEPPPTPEPARFEALPVPGHLDAVVSLPEGGERQPLLVATHGAGGAPEHHCLAWREHLGQRGIILCPRGAMIDKRYGADAGFYYPNHFELEKEVLAALDSFEAAYGERVLPGGHIYAGYSQGATMGALMLPKHAQLFPRLILIEGGFSEWDLRGARSFKQNGGERVAFVCGNTGCKRSADRSAGILKRAEVATSTRHAVGGGHTYLGAVAREVHAAFTWLTQDDPRWSGG